MDADCLLAAQAKRSPIVLGLVASDLETPISVVVATTNPAHLARYVEARLWEQIGSV